MDELLKKVAALNQKESSEFEPYKFKYEAREILEGAIAKYDNDLKAPNLSDSDRTKLQIERIILMHNLAINFTDTEERSRATPLLSEVITFLTSSLKMRMRYVLVLLKSLNYMALIWSSMQNDKNSKKYLDQAEQLYTECYAQNNLKMIAKRDIGQLEWEYTHTLFYVAQLYKNLGHEDKSAAYCHKTLQRQLKLKIDDEQLNQKEWVINAVNLAAFYISAAKFRQAIHCIEAAVQIKASIASYSTTKDDSAAAAAVNNAYDDEEEEPRIAADIAKTWGVLYAELLRRSFDIMNGAANRSGDAKKNDTDEKTIDLAQTEQLIALDEKLKVDNTLIAFENMPQLKAPPKMQLASSYDEAKELFVAALNHCMNALQFYVLDGFVTDHGNISQTISDTYKYLAFFESDASAKCKLHKRRVNLLKEMERQLSVSAYPELVQELCYELGAVFETMGTLKKEILDGDFGEMMSQQPKDAAAAAVETRAKQIKKINDLYSNGVHYLSKYVNIFEFPPNVQSKEKQAIPELYRLEYFQAHFLMAVLYGKLIAGNKQNQRDNLQKSLSGYEHCFKFYSQDGPIEQCKVQFEIAREMKDLLPRQIASI